MADQPPASIGDQRRTPGSDTVSSMLPQREYNSYEDAGSADANPT